MAPATKLFIPQPHECQWEVLWEAPAAEGDKTWPVEICRRCGIARLSRIPSIAEAYSSEYYGNASKKFLPGFESLSHVSPVLLAEAERMAKSRAFAESRKPKVLDIGCGRGYLLKRLQQAGWDCAGIDIPESPVPANEIGLDCRHGDASILPWDDGFFDLVVINHVLEHVPDHVLACREAARVLRSGGILYLGVPNFGSWQSRLFGRNWFPLEIPRHLFHYTPKTLAKVVSEAGLRCGKLKTWSLTQGSFGFVQSVLNTIDGSNRNAFLSLVKGHSNTSALRALSHILGAFVLLPVGIVETFIASAFGRGPIVALIAQKPLQDQRERHC
jgi:2-polyprenyl-3-methyl-5-hydroxy-6-metoxy-1,4-benzoquinol methylase